MTVLRGRVVVERSEFKGDLADGRFIPRKLDGSVFTCAAG
jgi:hypothetical protein